MVNFHRIRGLLETLNSGDLEMQKFIRPNRLVEYYLALYFSFMPRFIKFTPHEVPYRRPTCTKALLIRAKSRHDRSRLIKKRTKWNN